MTERQRGELLASTQLAKIKMKTDTSDRPIADLYRALHQRQKQQSGLQSSWHRWNTRVLLLWWLPAPTRSAAGAVTCSVCRTPCLPPASPPGSPQMMQWRRRRLLSHQCEWWSEGPGRMDLAGQLQSPATKNTSVNTVTLYTTYYIWANQHSVRTLHLEELERNINSYIKIFLFFFVVIQFNNNSTCFGARVIKTKLNIIMIMLKMKDPRPPFHPSEK